MLAFGWVLVVDGDVLTYSFHVFKFDWYVCVNEG